MNHIDWDYAQIARMAEKSGYSMPTLGNDPEAFLSYMNDLRASMDQVRQVFQNHALTN